MNPLYQSAFLKALGWSLMDSLWQFGAMWLLYTILTANGRAGSSSSRHSLALTALFSGTVWFIASVCFSYNHIISGEPMSGAAALLQDIMVLGVPDITGMVMPFLSAVYLGILLFFILRWLIRFRRESFPEKQMEAVMGFNEFLAGLQQMSGLKRRVQLWFTENVSTPLTYGFLRPVILLPVAVLNQLSVKQVEAIIVHELYHVRRNDYLINFLLVISRVVFFFNPFARLLGGMIARERENCCDDEVIGLGYNRWEYAQALYMLGLNAGADHPLAVAATGSDKQLLLCRIQRMLKKRPAAPKVWKPLSVFFLCLFVAATVARKEEPAPQPLAVPAAVHAVQEVKKVIIVADAPAAKPKKLLPLPPPPPPSPVETGEPLKVIFVDRQLEELDYSMIIPVVPEIPRSVLGATPLPFVPHAAFYVPDHAIQNCENGKPVFSL